MKQTLLIVLLVIAAAALHAPPAHAQLMRGWPVGPTAEVSPPAFSDQGDRLPMYQRHADLVDTLVATRTAYQAWRSRQEQAVPLATFSAWQIATNVAAAQLEAVSREGAGGGEWTPLPAIKDDEIVPWKTMCAATPAFAVLYREITATQPVTLTIGLGGGTHQAVALNGKTLIAAVTARIERFNTAGTAQDDPVLDRLMVDLELKPGINRLAVAVRQDEPRRQLFACTRTVNPVQRLWDWLWFDFPATRYPFMDAMPAAWMGSDTIAPSKHRQDRHQMLARQYRTTTPELQEGRPYRYGYLETPTAEVVPLPEADRKPGLLHDGWFDARDLQFERAFLEKQNARLLSNDDPRVWLAACVAAASRAEQLRKLASLEKAVQALGLTAEFGKRIEELRGNAGQIDPAALAALQQEALVKRNPLLRGQTMLFVKRHTYTSHHVYDDYNHGIRSFVGNLYSYSFDTGQQRELLPQLRGGVFDRYDISGDARRVVFGYRRPFEWGMRIHEAALDGSWVNQLTRMPADEADRVRRHSEFTTEELLKSPTLHGHWTDDVHPCYLPDGGVAFVSTRPEHSIFCGMHETLVTTLHRVERDGSKLERLSNSALSELFPVMMDNGRLLYTRYEYVFKGNLAVHGLWSVRPDGRFSEEVYGNNIPVPPTQAYARQVPGRPDLVVCIGCSHETRVGSVELIDLRQDRRTPAAQKSLTPEISSYGVSNNQFRNGRWIYRDFYGPAFADPFPLNEQFFLVSYNPDKRLTDPRAYGIWLLDVFGNRVKILDDPDISCWQPILLQPRTAHELPVQQAGGEKTGTLVLVQADRGLPGVDPATIKHLRVLEQMPRTWDGTNRRADEYFPGSPTAVTMGTHIWVAVDHGVVPVEPDGSAHFTVPADRNIFLQLLDKDYRAIQTMRSYINMRPGEIRSCLGCHDDRKAAPPNHAGLAALQRPASVPVPQPGCATVPRPLHYPTDVQPILDRNCVSCHAGPGTKADLDLRGTASWLFSKSYMELLQRGLVAFIEEHKMAMGADPRKVFVPFAGMEYAEPVPPYKYGAHGSRLTKILDDPTHRDKLTATERLAITTWLDVNAQFYGSYFGYRSEHQKDHPHYRIAPGLETAQGHPPFLVHPMPGAP